MPIDLEKHKVYVEHLKMEMVPYSVVQQVLVEVQNSYTQGYYDKLDDKKTMSQMADWNREYTNIPGKKIGVVQGKTYKQIVACYEYMDKLADVDMLQPE
jgi:hypothetical protein